MNKPLIFDIALGQQKPENIRNKTEQCPFCDTDSLTNILDQQGSIIWLMNKFPVLQSTWPTVIIETDKCDGEFSEFPPEEATNVLAFSIEKWKETMENPEFKSVLYFKNYGPMSGGSIRHPHSQIIGLRDYDYREDITSKHFDGWTLKEDEELKITLSQFPVIGFFEFNLRFTEKTSISLLAKRLQQLIHYLLHDFSKYAGSYNIFFYKLDSDYYYIKVVSRYLTSPLFVGYSISQVCNESKAQRIQEDLQAAFI